MDDMNKDYIEGFLILLANGIYVMITCKCTFVSACHYFSFTYTFLCLTYSGSVQHFLWLYAQSDCEGLFLAW